MRKNIFRYNVIPRADCGSSATEGQPSVVDRNVDSPTASLNVPQLI